MKFESEARRHEHAKVGGAICGNCGLLEEDVQLGRLVHFVRDTDYDCEMRSQFWLFDAPDDFGGALLTHCLEEMGYLADLLHERIVPLNPDIGP